MADRVRAGVVTSPGSQKDAGALVSRCLNVNIEGEEEIPEEDFSETFLGVVRCKAVLSLPDNLWEGADPALKPGGIY